jgi:single-strand DNA-binding protein
MEVLKMLNQCTIMGRLTRDPELREAGGVSVCSFSIACDRDYANGDGEHETDFIDVVCWRKTAEFVSNYFSKGQMVVISGRLQIRQWTDKENNNRRSVEINAEKVYFGEKKKKDQVASNDLPPADDFNFGFNNTEDDPF